MTWRVSIFTAKPHRRIITVSFLEAKLTPIYTLTIKATLNFSFINPSLKVLQILLLIYCPVLEDQAYTCNQHKPSIRPYSILQMDLSRSIDQTGFCSKY